MATAESGMSPDVRIAVDVHVPQGTPASITSVAVVELIPHPPPDEGFKLWPDRPIFASISSLRL